jgi:MoaA/NifB/PqqE/SkfB family radical SAM enzyme
VRRSLYWDDFERRAHETVGALKEGHLPPVRRVAVFITDRCNFKCSYCNHTQAQTTLTKEVFLQLLDKYGDTALFHITGGEPSTVPWLYPVLEEYGDHYRFHLNTNAYVYPPAHKVKRLKISLDAMHGAAWDEMVGRTGAFERVLTHIKWAAQETVTSITYTMTRKNYRYAPDFARFVAKEVSELYAIFFSVYKGTDPEYLFRGKDVEEFFGTVMPLLQQELNEESLALLNETMDEKLRLVQGVRFPQNSGGSCYLSLSERVISPNGKESNCSHLYRDGVFSTDTTKHEKCLYGCNRRLVMFNELVENELKSLTHVK